MVLVEKVTQFTEDTSVHGISYFGQSNSTIKRRILWLFLFIGAITYAGLQIQAAVKCKTYFHTYHESKITHFKFW